MEHRACHLSPQSPLPPFSCGFTTGTCLAALCPVSSQKAFFLPQGPPPLPLTPRTRGPNPPVRPTGTEPFSLPAPSRPREEPKTQLLKARAGRARASGGHSYLSLGVSWQRLMSGTEVTPQRLYCPSPMERDTSSTPKTRPSLEQGATLRLHLPGHRAGQWGRGKGVARR